MIPHSVVRVVTSVAFIPFCIATEAMPNMSMAIRFSKIAWAFDKLWFVNIPQMFNNVAQGIQILVFTRKPCACVWVLQAHGDI